MIDVMTALKPIGDLFREGDLAACQRELEALWSAIPEPQTDTSNAYLVLEYGVAVALKAEDLDAAQGWAMLAPPFAKVRLDSGEVEFMQGKVAHARGEIAQARGFFIVAKKKSKGRIFGPEHGEFRKLAS